MNRAATTNSNRICDPVLDNLAKPIKANSNGITDVFEWRVRVYYEDTDAGGIVYYANYLRFFERARTEWLRAMGVNHRELAAQEGLQFVVRDLSIDYRKPARLDEQLMLTLKVSEARRASLTLEQSAFAEGTSDVLVSAQVRIVAVRCTSGRPAGLPKWLLNRVT